MRSVLLTALLVTALAVAACGDDDEDTPELTYETFAPGTTAYITGYFGDEFRYPNIEIWDQPECNYDRVLGNAFHGTKVRLIQKKTGCLFPEYEVELLEGDQVGQVGWLRERYVHLGEEPPEPWPATGTPTQAPEASPSAEPTPDATE